MLEIALTSCISLSGEQCVLFGAAPFTSALPYLHLPSDLAYACRTLAADIGLQPATETHDGNSPIRAGNI